MNHLHPFHFYFTKWVTYVSLRSTRGLNQQLTASWHAWRVNLSNERSWNNIFLSRTHTHTHTHACRDSTVGACVRACPRNSFVGVNKFNRKLLKTSSKHRGWGPPTNVTRAVVWPHKRVDEIWSELSIIIEFIRLNKFYNTFRRSL